MTDRGEDRSARPLRRYGQNFLVDRGAARRLVEAFDPTTEDVVVEIGPGRGALTELLAPRAGKLVAIELDGRLVPQLERLLDDWPRAEVRLADALTVDWGLLAREHGGRLRVIGNLPFNVGTAIVRRLLAEDAVRDAQVLLQLEVADRILASPRSKSYGPLSIVAALRTHRKKLAVLPPGAFRPRPKVRAAAVRLVALDDPPLPAAEIASFESRLFAGFGQRRKTLAGNLGPAKRFVREFLEEAGLPGDARAEAVPPAAWLALARRLNALPAPPSSAAGPEER